MILFNDADPMFPAESAPEKVIEYTAPLTSDGVFVMMMLFFAPAFNSIPTSVFTCGDPGSVAPPVRVQVMEPEMIFSMSV